MMFSIRGWSGPLVVLLALAGAVNCPAEGFDHGSLVGGLLDMGDMQPTAASDSLGLLGGGRPAAGIQASARQSVPSRDRSASYRSDELFRNSKVAMPLLVADLEPRVIAVAQPMSGRSVGARPAAAWTRPAVTTIANPRAAGSGATAASWAGAGR